MAHAILSPSGASRWLVCTPSARLEAEFPDQAGDPGKEGTLAHTLGELIIRRMLSLINENAYFSELSKIKKSNLFAVEMLAYMEDYATYVVEQFNAARAHTKDAVIYLEQKLDLTAYIPEGFGTGDTVIIADRVLDITDLKYGKGVPVNAFENKQMMLYGLAAYLEYRHLYSIDTVRMTIYQPRLDSISIYELPVKELLAWADAELRPSAKLAFEGKGEYVPSEQCRFCRAKAVCKANAEFQLELAKHEFKESPLLSDEAVADILSRAAAFKSWVKAVEENALQQAIAGKKWPGYKIVEGRSNRKYSNEVAVELVLREHGFTMEDIFDPPKVKGLTKLQGSIGKTDFNKYLSDLIVKPVGSPTLVPVTDKRPEMDSNEAAKADFAMDDE